MCLHKEVNHTNDLAGIGETVLLIDIPKHPGGGLCGKHRTDTGHSRGKVGEGYDAGVIERLAKAICTGKPHTIGVRAV